MTSAVKSKGSGVCQRPTWLRRSDCRNCEIFNQVIFSGLSTADVDHIVNGIYEPIDEFQYEAGAVIYQEGDLDHAVYTIRKGLVKAVRYQSNGAERIIRLHKRGDSIGLERLLARPYGHSAVVLRDAEVCRIPIETLQRLDEEKARFYRGLMQRWAEGLFQADDYIMLILSGTVRERVAHLIAWLAEMTGDPRRHEVELLSGKDLSAMVDVTAESISRTLADLKRRDILRHVHGERYHYDPEALDAYANEAT